MSRDAVLIGLKEDDWDVIGLPSEDVRALEARYHEARGHNCTLDGVQYDELRLYKGRSAYKRSRPLSSFETVVASTALTATGGQAGEVDDGLDAMSRKELFAVIDEEGLKVSKKGKNEALIAAIRTERSTPGDPGGAGQAGDGDPADDDDSEMGDE